jgi:purine-binding chemotaxis protein CheW
MNTIKESGTQTQTYLSFSLGDEVFAINVDRVINILEVSKITKIPKSPEYMKGVINLRGTVLPVIDLRVKFGLPEKEATVDTSIIVLTIDLNGDQILLGTLVDAVREVLELRNDDIAPAPSIGAKYNSGFIEGMWRHEDKFTMILEINKIFSTEEVIDFNEHIALADEKI